MFLVNRIEPPPILGPLPESGQLAELLLWLQETKE